MNTKNNNPERKKQMYSDYYDMTEDASERAQSDGGTAQARQLESDDVNEETAQGPVSSPSNDNWAVNKIATSLDDKS